MGGTGRNRTGSGKKIDNSSCRSADFPSARGVEDCLVVPRTLAPSYLRVQPENLQPRNRLSSISTGTLVNTSFYMVGMSIEPPRAGIIGHEGGDQPAASAKKPVSEKPCPLNRSMQHHLVDSIDSTSPWCSIRTAGLHQNLNRAFVLFELKPANEISLLDPYEWTLAKCCVDPLRPPGFLETGIWLHSEKRACAAARFYSRRRPNV